MQITISLNSERIVEEIIDRVRPMYSKRNKNAEN
jgi:hypothetical protein